MLRPALLTMLAIALPACGGDPLPVASGSDFELSTPPNTAIGVTGTPTFSWHPSVGTLSYTLLVALDGGFSTLLVNQSGIDTTSFSPIVTLSPGTVYYWHVVAERPTGNIPAEGSPWSFTTVAPVPGAFMMSAPSNGSMDVSPIQTFSWTSSLGTAGYRLQVSTDSSFGTLVVEQTGITTTSATPSVRLSPFTTYFWRVLAESSRVTPATGAPWTFTTRGSAPGSFMLVSPGSGLAGISTLPTYTWNAASAASSYRLQVALDPSFNITVVDQAGILTTFATPSTLLLPLTTYYWRVTAVNGSGSIRATPASSFFLTI